MIILVAALQAKHGKEEEVKSVLLDMIPKTAQEDGALEYRLHQSKSTTGKYLFFEKYASQAALDAHLVTPYYNTFIEEIGPMLTCEPLVDIYDFLDGIPEK